MVKILETGVRVCPRCEVESWGGVMGMMREGGLRRMVWEFETGEMGIWGDGLRDGICLGRSEDVG